MIVNFAELSRFTWGPVAPDATWQSLVTFLHFRTEHECALGVHQELYRIGVRDVRNITPEYARALWKETGGHSEARNVTG